MVTDARSAAPHMLGELPGFIADMDAAGAWEPVPILLAMAEPNGPVEQAFFDRMMAEWEHGLRDAGRLDGVYCVLHGAGLATARPRPRRHAARAGAPHRRPDVPVVASYDLHANVSDANVELVNAYHRLPHQPASRHARARRRIRRRCCAGCWRARKTHLARIRLPIVPPTVSMLTGKDAHERPVRRDDRSRPAAHARAALCRARAERLGDGRLRLRRHAVQRPHRRGHRDRRRCGAVAGARDRRGGMGTARAVPRDADLARRRHAACDRARRIATALR